MSSLFEILLPQIALVIAGCLCLLSVGLRGRDSRIAAVICVLGLTTAGGLLACADVEPIFGADIHRLATLSRDWLAIRCEWFAVILGFVFAVALQGSGGVRKRPAELYACLLFLTAGLSLAALSRELTILFLAVEIVGMSLVLLLLCEGWQCRQAFVGVRRYFFVSVASSACLLYGFSLLYVTAGSTNLAVIERVLHAVATRGSSGHSLGDSGLGVVAAMMVLAAIGMKLSLVPFHFANTDLSDEVSIWHVGLITLSQQAVAVVLALRIIVEIAPGGSAACQLAGIVICLFSLLGGATATIRHVTLRRILSSTAVMHGGLLMVAISAAIGDSSRTAHGHGIRNGFPSAVQACCYSWIVYSVAFGGLCLLLESFTTRDRRIDFIDDLRGLYRTQPLATAALVILLLSLAGFPPVAGFWGHVFILGSALGVQVPSPQMSYLLPHAGFVWLSVITAVSCVILAVSLCRVIVSAVFDDQVQSLTPNGGRYAFAMAFVTMVLIAGCGLMPGVVLRMTMLN